MDVIIVHGMELGRRAAQWFKIWEESHYEDDTREAIHKLGELQAYEALGYIARNADFTWERDLAKSYL